MKIKKHIWPLLLTIYCITLTIICIGNYYTHNEIKEEIYRATANAHVQIIQNLEDIAKKTMRNDFMVSFLLLDYYNKNGIEEGVDILTKTMESKTPMWDYWEAQPYYNEAIRPFK